VNHVTETHSKKDFPLLVRCGIIIETRRVAGVPLYAIDLENDMTQSLIRFDEELTDYCTDLILDSGTTIDDMQEAEDARDRFMAGPDYANGPEPEDLESTNQLAVETDGEKIAETLGDEEYDEEYAPGLPELPED